MRSIIAASVVDLPEPVVPVTSTRPRCSSQIFVMTGGRFNSSVVRIFVGMTRSTMPTLPRCWKTLTRKRPRPARSEEHTSELQSPCNLVCRLLLEKKKKSNINIIDAPKLVVVPYRDIKVALDPTNVQ